MVYTSYKSFRTPLSTLTNRRAGGVEWENLLARSIFVDQYDQGDESCIEKDGT